jgi:hypothetical protein
MSKESSVIVSEKEDILKPYPKPLSNENAVEVEIELPKETVTIQIAKENRYTPIPKEVVVKSADKTFPALLLRFNKLLEDMPKVSLIRAELDKISLDAYGSAELNYNQRSAIMERCSNYIKGDYGRKITA